jgi:hypothetical protein
VFIANKFSPHTLAYTPIAERGSSGGAVTRNGKANPGKGALRMQSEAPDACDTVTRDAYLSGDASNPSVDMAAAEEIEALLRATQAAMPVALPDEPVYDDDCSLAERILRAITASARTAMLLRWMASGVHARRALLARRVRAREAHYAWDALHALCIAHVCGLHEWLPVLEMAVAVRINGGNVGEAMNTLQAALGWLPPMESAKLPEAAVHGRHDATLLSSKAYRACLRVAHTVRRGEVPSALALLGQLSPVNRDVLERYALQWEANQQRDRTVV